MNRWVLAADEPPDGECDMSFCALKLISNLTIRNKLGIVEALKQFITVDSARALVTTGELAKYTEVQKIVPPNFDKYTFPHACVTEGDEVLTLRREDQRTQKFFADTSKIPGA